MLSCTGSKKAGSGYAAYPNTGAFLGTCRSLSNYRGAQQREGMPRRGTARFEVQQNCTYQDLVGHNTCAATQRRAHLWRQQRLPLRLQRWHNGVLPEHPIYALHDQQGWCERRPLLSHPVQHASLFKNALLHLILMALTALAKLHQIPWTGARMCHSAPRQGLPVSQQVCRCGCRLRQECTVRLGDGLLAAAGASAAAGAGAALSQSVGAFSLACWQSGSLVSPRWRFGCGTSAVSSHCAVRRLAALLVSADT